MSAFRKKLVAALAALGLAVAATITAVSVNDEPGKPSQCDSRVQAGANLSSAVAAAPAGATICIGAGTFTAPQSIKPKAGQRLVGAGVGATHVRGAGATIVIDGKTSANVTLQDFELSGASAGPGKDACKSCGRGASLGPNGRVLGMYIHHNPQNAVGGSEDGLVIEDSELAYNGSNDFVGCCAGGVKSANNFAIRRSYIHDNIGNGVWLDLPSNHMVVEGNQISGNSKDGVRHESNSPGNGSAIIRGNVIRNNGEAGVEINSAPNGKVTGNEFGGNGGAGVQVGGGRGPITGTVVSENYLNGDTAPGNNIPTGHLPGSNPSPSPSPTPSPTIPGAECFRVIVRVSDGVSVELSREAVACP